MRIHRVELPPSERAAGVPDDTAACSFEAWINGWLVEQVRLGEHARIETLSGRVVEGTLVATGPGYDHSFGSPPPALQRAGRRAQRVLLERGGEG